MRLIDAGAILKRAEESFKNAGLHGEDYRKFKKWLRTTPTIDAVEVVRCKDCKQRRVEGDCTHYYYCDFMGSKCGDNEYCSFGERDTTA